MTLTIPLQLDLTRPERTFRLYAHTGEHRSRRLLASFTRDTDPFPLTDTAVTVRLALPDGSAAELDCAVTDSAAAVTLPGSLFAAPGRILGRFCLYGGAEGDTPLLCSPGFEILVSGPDTEDAAALPPESTALTRAMAAAKAYETRWSNVKATAVTGPEARAELLRGPAPEDGMTFAFTLPAGTPLPPVQPVTDHTHGRITNDGKLTRFPGMPAGDPCPEGTLLTVQSDGTIGPGLRLIVGDRPPEEILADLTIPVGTLYLYLEDLT